MGLSIGDDRWVVDLLDAWSTDSARLAHPRVSPMFSRLADTIDEDRGDSEEMQAFRVAMTRLGAERPEQWAAVVGLTRRATEREDEPAVIAGLKQLARWVDETMGDA